MLGKKSVYLLFLFGIVTLTMRLLLDSRFANSAFVYVATPFILSFCLFSLTPATTGKNGFSIYVGHMRNATIFMLASSAVLFEGFICVLMFYPIYFLFCTLGFVFGVFSKAPASDNNRALSVAVVPTVILAVALMSTEGVDPLTSFDRQNAVTRTRVLDASVPQLLANMAKEITLPKQRHWFLSIFPLPVEVQAGSLEAGDVHTLKFIYKRWFFTNIDSGEFHLSIDSVSDKKVTTRVIKNTSYLAKYLDIKGTEVVFTPISDTQTQVSLTVHYDRLLDPAWYFGPMQNFAVGRSADYLIESVIVRELEDG